MVEERARESSRRDEPASGETTAPRELHVEGAPTRCPYCHESIALATETWLACEGCLARHHEACWKEGGKCSSCGSPHSLERSQPTPESRDAWRLKLEALVAASGSPMFLAETARRSPPAGEGRWARLIFGAPLVLERARRLDREVDPARHGAWLTRESSPLEIAIASDAGRTDVRLQVSMKEWVSGLMGGLVGGGGGGLGGGLSLMAYNLGGAPALFAWIGFCFIATYVIARLILSSIARRQGTRLEGLAAAVERELAEKQAPAERSPPRPSLKDPGKEAESAA